jgi:hypothetical protein
MDILNNASVGAFVGAFFAFILVAATDLRRRYRYRRLLTHLVSDNMDLARKKLESVQMNLALIQEDNKVTGSPFMHFPTQSIKDYQFQVLDILDANHKQGLDALVYWMEAIDGLLDEATQSANKLKQCIKRNSSNAERTEAATSYIDVLGESETNLNILIQLTGHYVNGEPHKILEFYHEIGSSKNT